MKYALFGIGALVASSAAHADICEWPGDPQLDFDPDGVERQDILDARDRVIDFQNALGAYRECLERNRASLTGIQADRLHDVSIEKEKEAVAKVKAMVDAFKRMSRSSR